MDINLPVDPPVNNNIQSTVYDKLDQVAFERIRVANTLLDTRLSIQEKIINKYRKDVERVHAHQMQRLRREARKIREKKPNYVFDDSDISTSRSRAEDEIGRKRCLSEPPSNLSYCKRYYSHHYNLKYDKDKRNEKEETSNPKKKGNDFFNLAFRLYFINMMKNGHGAGNTESEPLQSDDLGKSLDSSMMTSPRRCPDIGERGYPYNAQSSVEEKEEEEDVFMASHTSLPSNLGSLRASDSTDCLADIQETSKETQASETCKPERRMERRERNSDGDQKIRRRKSMATELDKANYSRGLRKTKNAFEKLFAGLL